MEYHVSRLGEWKHQTLYPGDTGGGGFPWDTTSGLGSLIQQIAGSSSSPGSAFGLNDLGSLGSMISDIVSQLGPPSQNGKGDLTKLLNAMFQMPVMNQYSGNFGSRQDDVSQMIAEYAAQLHSIGDPTHGRRIVSPMGRIVSPMGENSQSNGIRSGRS